MGSSATKRRLNTTMRAVDRDPLSKARGRCPTPEDSPWGNGLETGHSCKDSDLRLVTLRPNLFLDFHVIALYRSRYFWEYCLANLTE